MEFFILLISTILAVATAHPGYIETPLIRTALPFVRSSRYHSQDSLGQYNFGYTDGLSTKHEVKAYDGTTRGSYSYVDPEGKLQTVDYSADPVHGFRVAATNLPKPVPIPEFVHPIPVMETPEVMEAARKHFEEYEKRKMELLKPEFENKEMEYKEIENKEMEMKIELDRKDEIPKPIDIIDDTDSDSEIIEARAEPKRVEIEMITDDKKDDKKDDKEIILRKSRELIGDRVEMLADRQREDFYAEKDRIERFEHKTREELIAERERIERIVFRKRDEYLEAKRRAEYAVENERRLYRIMVDAEEKFRIKTEIYETRKEPEFLREKLEAEREWILKRDEFFSGKLESERFAREEIIRLAEKEEAEDILRRIIFAIDGKLHYGYTNLPISLGYI